MSPTLIVEVGNKIFDRIFFSFLFLVCFFFPIVYSFFHTWKRFIVIEIVCDIVDCWVYVLRVKNIILFLIYPLFEFVFDFECSQQLIRPKTLYTILYAYA